MIRQFPRPAQRGEGQGEGSKTRPDKPCRSLSSHRGSKPVKVRQSKNSRPTGESGSAIGKRGDSSDPTDPTDASAKEQIRDASQTALAAPNRSEGESNPVAPGQSETSALANTADSAEGAQETASSQVVPGQLCA